MDVEVAVVGAGVTGMAAAWRLAAAGREVLVCERFTRGHERGSSHGATRIFRTAYSDPLYVRMAQAALGLWKDLGVLTLTGGLDIGPAQALDQIEQAMTSCGAASERLEPREVRARFPWLSVDGPALHSPDYGVLAAARALERMAEAASAGGATVWEDAPAEIAHADEDGVTLQTPRGDVRARHCVLAAGAWMPEVLAGLGVRVPLRVTREQVFYFRAHTEVVPFIAEQRMYGVPALGDAPGVKVAEHMTGPETTADGRGFEVDAAGAARVRGWVERFLPGLDPSPVASETCLYTTTPDEGFVIGARGSLVIASPCSGHGFKFAPVVGEICAALATGREPPFPIERFDPERFDDGRLG